MSMPNLSVWLKRSFARSIFAGFVLGAPLLALGDTEPLPKTEAFFDVPDVGIASISPSGDRLAMTIRGKDGRLSLVACATDDMKSCTFILKAEDADIVNVAWINDKRLVIQTGDYQKNNYRADGNLYAANADGSEVVPLIDAAHGGSPRRVTGSIIERHELGGEYVFLQRLEDSSDDIIVGLRTFGHIDHAMTGIQPLRLNTKTGLLTPVPTGNRPAQAKGWIFDHEGVARIFTAIGDGKRTVYYRASTDAEWSALATYDALDGDGLYPTAFDSDGALLVTTRHGADTAALYRYDLKSGTLDAKPLIDLKGYDYNGSLEFDPHAKKLLGAHFETDALGSAWFNPQMREIQSKLDHLLPTTINTLLCGNCLSSSHYLVIATSDRQPSIFLMYDPSHDQLVKLGSSHQAIRPAQMGTRDFFHYKARDGLDLPVYVTLPPGYKTGALPTVVLIHGGPWVRGARWEWEDQSQFLASRGYVVIEPEFRGTVGYGDHLFRASFRQWGLAMQDDVADAAKWAIDKGYADPKRIAVAGASYGGYATLMGLIKNPELFRCGFEWVGVTDLDMMFSVEWNDASIEQLKYGMPALIGDPEKDAVQFKATSPLANAAKLTQPILMAYGADDRRVPIVQGTAFYDAVSSHNKNVEWIVYSEEGHGWRHEGDNVDFWNHVEKFLDKNLKNAP